VWEWSALPHVGAEPAAVLALAAQQVRRRRCPGPHESNPHMFSVLLKATQIGPLPQLITNTCDISPPSEATRT
jgi:hypothetical protein